MDLIKKVQEKIKAIENDLRYQSGLKSPAMVDINAPLALIQTGFESQIGILKWVEKELIKRAWVKPCKP